MERMREGERLESITAKIKNIVRNLDDTFEIFLENSSKAGVGPDSIIVSRKFLEQQKVWGSLLPGMEVDLTLNGEGSLVEIKKIFN